MAYRKLREHRVFTGAMSLVAPSDKIEDKDARLMQNFRVDQAGTLRSRKGHTTIQTVSKKIHTIYRKATGDRYLGAGDELIRGSSPIATGFDQQPMSILDVGGRVWVMNRAKQGKDDGSNFRNWSIAAPGTAPTVSAGAISFETLSSFDVSETWTVIDPDGNSHNAQNPFVYPLGFDASNAQQGESLHVECNPTGPWQLRRTLASPIDLGIAGLQRDDDEFRIWFYASDPAAVTEVVVTVDVNAGDFTDDFYTITFPQSMLNANGYSWTRLKGRRAPSSANSIEQDPEYIEVLNQITEARNAGDDLRVTALEQRLIQIRDAFVATPAFVRTGSTAGKDWSTVKAIRILVRVTEAVDVHFDQADFAGAAGAANLRGKYTWYVTFDNAVGDESNPSPVSAEVEMAGQSAALTNIPVSADPQVTTRHIYRIGGALGQAYRVKTIANNTATTITDDVPDETAQEGVVMEEDHDVAPAASGAVAAFGRVLAYSTSAYPGRYWWTLVGRPAFFPAEQFSDTGEGGEDILAVTVHKRSVFFYKERSVWWLGGDPENTDPYVTNASTGTVGPRAVATAGAVDYFVGQDGVYRFNGDYAEKISYKIQPIFHGQPVQLTHDLTIQPMDDTNRAACVLEYSSERLYLSYPEAGQSVPTATLVYHLPTGEWAQYRLGPTFVNGGYTALHNEGHRRGLIGSTWNGTAATVVDLETVATDGGTAIPVQWLGGAQDMGLPDTEKVIGEVVVDYQTAVDAESASAVTLKLYWNNGASNTAIGSLSSATRTQARFTLGVNGQGVEAVNVAPFLDGVVSSTIVIYGIYLFWYPLTGHAVTFDTGSIDAGTELLKRMKAFEVDIETSDTLTWRASADMLSASPTLMTQADSATIAHVSGRRTLRVQLANTATEGFRHRLTFVSPGAFQIHALRVLMWTIGEQFRGSAGETWESAEMLLGANVEGFKEVMVYYRAPNGADLQLLTDRPGNAVTLRDTASLPAAANFRALRIPLDDSSTIEGAIAKWKLVSTGTVTLLGGWFRTRPLGLYFDGTIGEKWETLEEPIGTTGDPAEFKSIRFTYKASAGATVKLFTDRPGGAIAERASLALPASTGYRTYRLPLDTGALIEGTAYRVQVTSPGEVVILSASLQARVLGLYFDGSIGEKWDSGEISVGNGGIEEFKEAYFVYRSTAQVNVAVQTDKPGGTMTTRTTLILPTSAAFRSIRLPLDNVAVEAALLKLVATSGGQVTIREGWLRSRTVGLYIDGAAGDTWTSQVLDAGVFPRVKLFREIEIELAAEGAINRSFSTDIPGNAIAVRDTAPLNTSGSLTRRPVEAVLPGTTRGKIYQVSLSGSGSARVYRGRVRAKVLGEGATGWQWVPLPIPETPDDYNHVNRLPIAQTPNGFPVNLALPVPATPNEYTNVRPLPIRPVGEQPVWVTISVDALE